MMSLYLLPQQMARLAADAMVSYGTQFLTGCVPTSVEKCGTTGQLSVHYQCENRGSGVDTYDTLLLAIGRQLAVHVLSA